MGTDLALAGLEGVVAALPAVAGVDAGAVVGPGAGVLAVDGASLEVGALRELGGEVEANVDVVLGAGEDVLVLAGLLEEGANRPLWR